MDSDYALFATVVEAGSLSAAGRTLFISPAMVSKRLARLEARLGARLLHRTTRKLVLTEAGQRFHGDVVEILRATRAAEERITGLYREPAGLLRVSAPTSFCRLHMAPQLNAFLIDHPKVELEINLSDSYVDLLSERFDVAIRITNGIPASLEARRLATNRRILCASPAYIASHGMPENISDLSRHQLLAATGQMPWRLISGRKNKAVEGKSYVRTNSSEIVRELAIAGTGIALRSLWDVGEELGHGRLVRVLPEWEGPHDLGIYAVYPRSPTISPTVDVFVKFFERCFNPAPWDATAAHQGTLLKNSPSHRE